MWILWNLTLRESQLWSIISAKFPFPKILRIVPAQECQDFNGGW